MSSMNFNLIIVFVLVVVGIFKFVKSLISKSTGVHEELNDEIKGNDPVGRFRLEEVYVITHLNVLEEVNGIGLLNVFEEVNRISHHCQMVNCSGTILYLMNRRKDIAALIFFSVTPNIRSALF